MNEEAIARMLAPPPVPTTGDSFFSRPGDRWNEAKIESPTRYRWTEYAIGHKDAADLLAEHAERNQRSNIDGLVYPIMFLYRQYLELHLKDLARELKILRNLPESAKNHDINSLWKQVIADLKLVHPDHLGDEYEEISRLVGEISSVDPGSMAFRYPDDKGGKPYLQNINPINVRHVREVIGKIAAVLDATSSYVYNLQGR